MAVAHIEIEQAPDRDARGRFEKGRPLGRPPGAKNKATTAVKDALMQAFEEAGGGTYLLAIARSDPRTFCMLLAKLIPHELKVAAAGDELPLVTVKDYTGGRGGNR